MSRLKKNLIILQLCLSFTYLIWLCMQPYAKNTLSQKYTHSLYQMVIEKKELFSTLDEETQKSLVSGYEKVFPQKKLSYLAELKIVFFQKTSPFALGWLFFSIVVSLLLRFDIENGAKIAWILPALVVFYAFFQKHCFRKQSFSFSQRRIYS